MMNNNNWHPRGFGGGEYQYNWSFGPDSLINLTLASFIGIIFVLLALFAIAIKGYALWHAAKRNEKWWFIALLLINTLGLLELVYLIFIAKIWFRGALAPAPKKEDSGDKSATPTIIA